MKNTAKKVKPATQKQTQSQQQARTVARVSSDSKSRYRRLFETAQDGVLLLDAQTGALTDVITLNFQESREQLRRLQAK